MLYYINKNPKKKYLNMFPCRVFKFSDSSGHILYYFLTLLNILFILLC